MKISFCTTNMNRSFQMAVTLPINLNLISKFPNTELVIVDYASKDNFDETVKNTLRDFNLKFDQLKIVKVYDRQFFEHSRSKNIAHKEASGDVLCNLDIDNFLTQGVIDYMFGLFSKNINVITDGENPGNGGTTGRISLSKDNFYKLGGYDESFDGFGYGCEDIDLRERAIKYLQCQKITIPAKFLLSLSHDNIERTKNLEYPHFNIDYKKRMSDLNLKSGNMNPNGELWGIY